MPDLRGWVRYSPKFPLTEQRAALMARGVAEAAIYDAAKHDIKDVIKAKRKGTVLVVDGLHRLAESWPQMTAALHALAKAEIKVMDARTGYLADPKPTALLAEARRVYSGEQHVLSSEDARARGSKGGKAAAKKKRVPLGKEHQVIWKDVARYPTNREAAAAISKLLKRPVSIPTLRRKFGHSGRLAGWPVRGK